MNKIQWLFKFFNDPEIKKCLNELTTSSKATNTSRLINIVSKAENFGLFDDIQQSSNECILVITQIIRSSIPNILDYVFTIPYKFFIQDSTITSYISTNDLLNEIDNAAFESCINLETVDLLDSRMLQSIKPCTFYGCEKLATVRLPSSIEFIGYRAFAECSKLKEIFFNGTIGLWTDKASNFDRNWYDASNIDIIHCLDGDVYI